MTPYSGNNPAFVSEKCYTDIERSLERFYNSEHNPFRHLFENSRRVTQKYVTTKLDLVIEDYFDNEDMVLVKLQGKTNTDFQPFKQAFHKIDGEID